MNSIFKNAVVNAFATALYIVLIASFLFHAPKFFGRGDDTVLIPIIMLLLFVFSAAVTGLLVFARPLLWYWDGKKKEAFSLIVSTLLILFIITLIAILTLLVLSQ